MESKVSNVQVTVAAKPGFAIHFEWGDDHAERRALLGNVVGAA